MVDSKIHKFDEKLDITYSQFIKDMLAGEVALQKELERVLGKEKARQILHDWAKEKTVRGLESYLEKAGVQIETFDDFKKHQDDMWNSTHVKHTHTCKTIVNESDRVTYLVTECIWAKAMQELDATELGRVTICDTDFDSASVYNPKIELIRTKTLMNGDECCDFTYIWKN